MYKMAVFDIDGTLLNSQSQISKENLEAVKKAKELGIKIILATGKHHLSAQPLYQLLDLTDPQVSCNGAIIYCPESKKIIKTNPIDKETYLSTLEKLKEFPFPSVVYTAKGFYSTYSPEDLTKIIRVGENKIEYITDYSNLEDVAKILLVLPYHLKREEKLIRDMANENISVVRTSEHFLEFVAPASNKALAVKYIADMYNISEKEIIAFGDSENDVEMLKMAGLGVCMGNGSKIAKENADVIVSDNDKNGVKEGLYRFVINR
ncbi:Cof-type HAD-IIB family hydrolase [Anaerobranca gottschalkii]|uniref:Cof subfamily of IIB subfamily of haloacid dehalogenase superfamily/HAD-superfamily hydrolase, subfamily IIB n=1 Tax=Anaerobranca gottschalkii DSM 13577 TaxID=1120990 RepID=A0A1H9ZI08_9FIRM|nr:Cof-type HAD-IIB family hydrolase [Anaerobranca gottschalkii]SES81327.1 hypothetical protein SAMN03080614_100954 [Anaerobranca gottschalkii DSM 13577]